ncbi:HAD family hydrolase [Kozakia baliensis]|uniref:HAD family hydrolase n=1 Tax=Kozakia baliensis TaxID=153496 RepID=UPI00089DBC6C|nr:HAD hydrolase-like protein [Kozakia baliensis]
MVSKISFAVFDLDGTLIDSLPDLSESGALLLRHHGLREPPAEQVRPMIGDGVRLLVERLLDFAGAGPELDRSVATKEFLAIYEPRAAQHTRLFPGAIETLKTLRACGIRSAICTNKPVAAATAIAERLGFSDLIDGIGGGDSFSVRKPNPEHIRLTVHAAGGDIGRAVMIGDHRNDMEAAKGVPVPGLFAAWGYGTDEMSRDATRIAENILQIPSIIEEL